MTTAVSPTHRRRTVAMFVLMLVLAALDQTILATALPAITRDLQAREHLSWLFSTYLIAATVVIPLYGKLADVHGSRPMLLTAVVLFLLGSLACGFSPRLDVLIAARGLQGLGGGGLLTLAMLGVADLYPPQERGRVQGLLGASYGLATMFGPLVGGYLVEHLSWHWAFFINVPGALLALAVLGRWFRPGPARHPQRIDVAGALLLAAALVCLLLATRREAGWTGAVSAALVAAAAVAALGFVAQQRRAAAPLIPLSLFGSAAFAAATLISGLSGVALFSAVVFLPSYLQITLGLTPSGSAWHLLPLMAGVTLAAMAAGRRLRSSGQVRALARLSSGLVIGGFVALVLVLRIVPAQPLALSACVLPLGLGLGLLFPLVTMVSHLTAPPRLLGVATAVPVMLRSLGGAVGVSLLGALLAHEMRGQGLGAVGTAAGGMAAALQPVYGLAAILGGVCAVASRWLPERLMRPSATAAAPAPGENPGHEALPPAVATR